MTTAEKTPTFGTEIQGQLSDAAEEQHLKQKVIVVQLPTDTTEDVDKLAQELADMLDMAECGATVTVVEPDLADYINMHLND